VPKANGEGQPVQPETKADAGAGAGAGTGAGTGADAGTGVVVADAGQPKPAAGPPLDADTKTMLEEARKAYDTAKGNARKLQPVGTKLEEILAKAPDNPEALTLLAQVHLEQGKMDESLKTANHCTEVSPDAAACWLTIGVIQETKGVGPVAKLAYQKYLELAPDGRYAKGARQALKRLK
jgi:tetratricopeptide (TPR) repeat protein